MEMAYSIYRHEWFDEGNIPGFVPSERVQILKALIKKGCLEEMTENNRTVYRIAL